MEINDGISKGREMVYRCTNDPDIGNDIDIVIYTGYILYSRLQVL